MTIRAGVVGWPIDHSLSPVLHGYWLEKYKIDGTYEKVAARPEEFGAVIANLRAKGFAGVNVTVPHKEAAFALANKFDDAAPFAGAANLLVFVKDGSIGASNTDVSGIRDSLMQALGNISLGGKNIVLLGAGGAARATAYALQALKVAKISVLNRHKDRADQLVAHISKYRPEAKFETGTLEDWKTAAADAWLVINTTSAGMKGNPPLSIDLSALKPDVTVCDIVYNPLQTPLLEQAAARGLRTVDGLGMLMHQAAPSFEAFFGVRPQVDAGLRARLEGELRARG